MANNSDDETPAINQRRSIWNLHPESSKVDSSQKIPAAHAVPLVGGNGANQRVLEDILSEVRASLTESRLIRLSGQATAAHALKMFEKVPALERRIRRVEVIAISAALINIALLLGSLCR